MSGKPPVDRAVPAALVLVRDFVNTNDRERGRDELDSPAALRRWLLGRGLLGEEVVVDVAAWARARAVRGAMRALLLANNGDTLRADAVATLNRVAADAPLLVRFGEDGRARLVPNGGGGERVLGLLLLVIHEGMADDTWPRLKACRGDICQWAFYDTSKNRSRIWCAMAVCGSRLKVRAYRQRRRIAGADR